MNRNELTIAKPCTVDWKTMTPAEGGRFCASCKKVVKSFSSMTEREARALLRSAANGELCVRFAYDAHGRVFFGKDAPRKDPLVPASLLVRARRVAAAAAIGALPFATQACEAITSPLGASELKETALPPGHENVPPGHDEVMGGVAYDPDDQPPAAVDGGDGGADGDASAEATEDASTADGGSVEIY